MLKNKCYNFIVIVSEILVKLASLTIRLQLGSSPMYISYHTLDPLFRE